MVFRYDPFNTMLTIQDRMNRMFDDYMQRPEREPENAMVEWRPLADVFEATDRVVISLDVPGVPKEAIQVAVENNILTVRGDRQLDKDDKKNYHRLERAFGTFSRSFNLPATVNPERVTANYQNGVLEISLPKKEELKPRTVDIKIG